MDNSSLLLTPSAKKNKGITREYPFPIVTSSCAEGKADPNWKCVEGHLHNNFVLVHDEEGMRTLYSMLADFDSSPQKWSCVPNGNESESNYPCGKAITFNKIEEPGTSIQHVDERMIASPDMHVRSERLGYYGKGTLSRNAPKVCLKSKKAQSKEKVNAPVEELPSDVDVIDVLDSDDDEGPPVKREKLSDDVDVVVSDDSSEGKSQLTKSESERESLQLSLEEAYFLSYGLGCLIVMEKNQPMNLARLWNRFCELTPNDNFPIKYTAYHHFRSKGWIVKSGLKYGTDFLLYKDGPPFYHSTYSVIVKGVKEQNLRDMRGNPQFTWASLSALNRVNSTAGKGLMFLYVIKPSTVSDSKISTPYCVQQFKLEEVLFKRWVPSENREEND